MTPVDWWHLSWAWPIVMFLGWLGFFRFRPSARSDWVGVSAVAGVFLIFCLSLWQESWSNNKEEKAKIDKQFKEIASHYPELSEFTFSKDSHGNIETIHFTEPDKDRCQGTVDNGNGTIYDVTCRENYKPEDEEG